jgi:hypothetical protein
MALPLVVAAITAITTITTIMFFSTAACYRSLATLAGDIARLALAQRRSHRSST